MELKDMIHKVVEEENNDIEDKIYAKMVNMYLAKLIDEINMITGFVGMRDYVWKSIQQYFHNVEIAAKSYDEKTYEIFDWIEEYFYPSYNCVMRREDSHTKVYAEMIHTESDPFQ